MGVLSQVEFCTVSSGDVAKSTRLVTRIDVPLIWKGSNSTYLTLSHLLHLTLNVTCPKFSLLCLLLAKCIILCGVLCWLLELVMGKWHLVYFMVLNHSSNSAT